jgi:ADP-heptose:LPS heptosyltransferase
MEGAAPSAPNRTVNDSNYRPVRYPGWKVAAARLIEIALRPLVAAATPPRGLDAVRRILIVEPFRLGDAALLRGMFEPLHARFPGAEIHLLLHPGSAALYRDGPDVAQVHVFAFPWADVPGRRRGWADTWRFLRSLRPLRFDIGIDPRGDVRSHAALALAGCSERAGFTNYLACNIRVRGALLTRSAGDLPLAHRVELHDAVLGLLGCRPADPPVRVPRRTADGRVRVAISTGAGWAYRLWPEERWTAVVRWLGGRGDVDVHLVGVPAEGSRLERIVSGAGGVAKVRITDLRGLFDELEAADLVVCPDSAVMHLASEWFGVPVLALFGPGVVPLYRPRSAGSRVIDRQSQYACAPCTQQRCIHPDRPCMGAIHVGDVIDELAAMLGGGEKKGGRMKPET